MGNPKKSSNTSEDLHMASRNGDLQRVQAICSSNPLSVNSRDKHSRTPLHLAAWSGQTEVVRYLCQHKADVGAAAMDDMAAIHFASQKGHLDVVRILLSSGVSVKAANRKGLTPLHYAAQGSHLELANYLIRKGASLSVKTKAGKTPLDLANEEVRSFLLECEKPSLKKQEKSNEGTEAGDSSPKQAGKNGDVDSAGEAAPKHIQEDAGDRKKKGDESEISTPEPKRAKVALNHLMAEDDLQEEEYA